MRIGFTYLQTHQIRKKTSGNNLLMFIISSIMIELIDNTTMIEDNKDNY